MTCLLNNISLCFSVLLQSLGIKYISSVSRLVILSLTKPRGPRQPHFTGTLQGQPLAIMSCLSEVQRSTADNYSHIFGLVATPTCAHFAAVLSQLHTEYQADI